mgnify:CR=1 FL=1
MPGIGPKSALRIIQARRTQNLGLAELKRIGVVVKRAQYFITCKGRAAAHANRAEIANALLDPKACLDAPAPAQPSRTVMSHATSEDEFSRLQADKNDMAVLALEDAAREAANTIFSLRRHRIELITGEAGENVFGEGLKAALAEIERLEQSYLELFLGKRVVTTETRRYVVYPQSDKKQYIVCRFSAAAGLLPESDLSGDMVLLQIEPSGNTATAVEASAKESNTVTCRVADPSVCTVIAGGREYARAVLPLFEFGRTINVALPRRK